jgi:hypothetical protein
MKFINSAFVAFAILVSASFASADPIILNADFQTPALTPGTYSIDPSGYAGQGWTFNTTSGLATSGSGYDDGDNLLGPFGETQVAFIQSPLYGGSFPDSIDQVVDGFVPGQEYEVSFYAEQRDYQNSQEILTAFVGGEQLTFSSQTSVDPVANSWTLYTSDPFTVSDTNEDLLFDGNATQRPGDNAAFLADVSMQQVSTPEPATLLLMGSGLLALARRLRKKVA